VDLVALHAPALLLAGEGVQPMKAEWKGRTAFAEIAEALDVQTDEIMAAMPLGGGQGFVVLYTPEPELIWQARLERDSDRVLRLVKHGFLCTVEEFTDGING
jgi:hypothetical protein